MASDSALSPPSSEDPARPDRRDALVGLATELLAAGDIEAVTFDSVAERAGVSRPLVYKYFANRNALLAAVYEREADLLHDELRTEVMSSVTTRERFQVLVRGALRAQAERGAIFAALHAAGLRTRDQRARQLARDRATLRYFTDQAVRELGLDRRPTRAAVALLLGTIEIVLAQWRAKPTTERAAELERAYLVVVAGTLERLAVEHPAAS